MDLTPTTPVVLACALPEISREREFGREREDTAQRLVRRPAQRAIKRSLGFPAYAPEQRLRYGVATAVLLGCFLGALLAPPRPVWLTRQVHLGLGVAGAVLLCANVLVALRRRGLLGLGGRGHYALWVGLHLLSTLGGLAVLTVHVAGRRSYGAPFWASIAIALVVLSGLPGALLWQRPTHVPLLKEVKRHWLRLHVALLGFFFVALAAHMFQVAYF
ncbi:MAG TPA: hypothetical protein VH877_05640 [Polyangia bacterium]|jgi:hypothetical protein|nr:hypothetical protein [Polyangia bacterium]